MLVNKLKFDGGLFLLSVVIAILCFQATGNLHRFNNVTFLGEKLGITTLLALLLLLEGLIFFRAYRAIVEVPFVLFLAAFNVFVLFGVLFSDEPINSLGTGVQILAYSLIAVFITTYKFTVFQVLLAISAFVITHGFVIALSMLDYFAIIETKAFNSYSSSGDTFLFGNTNYLTASFHSRTAFASISSMAIGIATYFCISKAYPKKTRSIWIFIFSILICGLLLSSSRGLALSLFLLFVLMGWVSFIKFLSKFSVSLQVDEAPLSVPFLLFYIGLISVSTLLFWLAIDFSSGSILGFSDGLRIRNFIEILNGEQIYFWGNADPSFYYFDWGARKQTHNNFLWILMFAGWPGLIAFLSFLVCLMIKASQIQLPPPYYAMICGLIMFHLFGLTHDTLFNLSHWIILGLFWGGLKHKNDQNLSSAK